MEVDAALGASEASAELLELDDDEEAGREARDALATYAPAEEAEDIAHTQQSRGETAEGEDAA